ncbi:MAG: 30S ribosomal protein S20 [Deltaproteobacteria bacterium]|nr:30S ribosomal protein S20 [Deltaproteobacteria bacterium]
MAQHKSAEKRHRQSEARRARNTALRSRMKNAVKAARAAITEGRADKAAVVKEAIRIVQHSVSKNIIRSETASRTVSRLMRAAG